MIENDEPALRVLAARRALVIGHRGFCHVAPENTLPCFKLAMDCGVDLVELDFRETKDGVAVVIHDPELRRTTDARRQWKRRRVQVADKTLSELQTLDAGGWFEPNFAGTKVPTLAEALELIRTRSVALIEQKAGNASTCIELLRAKALINRVIVQSFDWRYLRQFHEAEPRQALAALGPPKLLATGRRPLRISRKLNRAWLNQAEKVGARVVVWNPTVSRGSIRLAHQRGFKVWVYTVNEERLARRLLRAGVDGLITNNPPLIKGVLEDCKLRG